jgi:hypothetical protein
VKKICSYVLTLYLLGTASLVIPAPQSPDSGEMLEVMQYILMDLQAKRTLLEKELEIRTVPISILPSWADLLTLSVIDTTVTEPLVVDGYVLTDTMVRAPFTIRGKTVDGVPIMYVLGAIRLDPQDPKRAASCTVRFDLYADITLTEKDTTRTHVRLNLLNKAVPALALKGNRWESITDETVRTSLLQRLGVEMPSSGTAPRQPHDIPSTSIEYGI